ncbi:hypothetical protein [Xenorhabdus anantnagensis]|uniref:Uncharacterized protein n=1 Tax=Xenorhabdus anantnagensis TaxID=3025875 RepID=A0ABT5LYW8_9GAMM|nr:hypothetical protein [Xenorhabdus anantnagensis]MDC9598205.1 hypothetical protein [Xenorhabdus anantnagensis]
MLTACGAKLIASHGFRRRINPVVIMGLVGLAGAWLVFIFLYVIASTGALVTRLSSALSCTDLETLSDRR